MASFSDDQRGICSHAEYCGGCGFQGIGYGEQLRIKDETVRKLLENKGIDCGEYPGIIGSPCVYAYRNKMEYTFGDLVKGGSMTLGMHLRGRFMSVVTVDKCQIVDQDFNDILAATLAFCAEKGYAPYNKKARAGYLRNLIIRKGVRTKELLINIVTTSQGRLDESGYIDRLLKLNLNNDIVGIINTMNDGIADVVHCDELNVLWGRGYYTERIMDIDFKVGAFSFFQTNVDAVERMYSDAVSMIEPAHCKTAFDLYCGTGTISQALAKKAAKVIGVELQREAVDAARENAESNGIGNCEFIAGDVLDVMEKIMDEPDVIVLDPPRAGVHPKALERIAKTGAGQIVYISCNPQTFAENLNYLQISGYRPEKIRAYDNFPFTRHCECVASLKRER